MLFIEADVIKELLSYLVFPPSIKPCSLPSMLQPSTSSIVLYCSLLVGLPLHPSGNYSEVLSLFLSDIFPKSQSIITPNNAVIFKDRKL